VLLEKARSSSSSSSLAETHTIHRFPGYQLLERRPADAKALKSSLQEFKWDSEHSIQTNVQRLCVACLAAAAAFPTGMRMNMHDIPPDRSWIDTLKSNCESSVSIIVIEDKGSLTFLIQEKSKASKYAVYQYELNEQCRILTREPRENRLSLHDLVSHRTTGVDNTGNICVWDSERSLAYLLYHHLDDIDSFLSKPLRRIMELGTGMAGLAAVAIGMRLNESHDAELPIEVTLTDGHLDGVQNNRVNMLLTRASIGADSRHPYCGLRVSEKVLLWTTSAETSLLEPQDLVLVSDCTHFQSFHAALAVTALRSLRVNGAAIFCQPPRAESLDNFCKLLKSVPDLLSLEWVNHPMLEDSDVRARASYPDLYDPALHHPLVLMIRKLRDLTNDDCYAFVNHQKLRETKADYQ
jgi:hypothetical protein